MTTLKIPTGDWVLTDLATYQAAAPNARLDLAGQCYVIGTPPVPMSPTAIRMHISGIYFDPFNCTPEMIDIRDIARGLALRYRFLGQTREPYSVAQHSVAVSRMVPPDLIKAALLHDAVEAYLGDVVTPWKVEMGDYRRLYARVERAVLKHFGLAPNAFMHPDIKSADEQALQFESVALQDVPVNSGWSTSTPLPLCPLSWQAAEGAFMARWWEVCGAGAGDLDPQTVYRKYRDFVPAATGERFSPQAQGGGGVVSQGEEPCYAGRRHALEAGFRKDDRDLKNWEGGPL